MNGKFGKDLEKSSYGLNEVLFCHFPEGTEENHERSQSGQLKSQLRFKPSIFRI
jgi:hypothetical protein